MAAINSALTPTFELGEMSQESKRRPRLPRGLLLKGAAFSLAAVLALVACGDSDSETAGQTDAAAPTADAPGRPTTSSTKAPATTESPPATIDTSFQVFDRGAGQWRPPTAEESAFAQTPCEDLYKDGKPVSLTEGKFCTTPDGRKYPIATHLWLCVEGEGEGEWLFMDDFGSGYTNGEVHPWSYPGEALPKAVVDACVEGEIMAAPPVVSDRVAYELFLNQA